MPFWLPDFLARQAPYKWRCACGHIGLMGYLVKDRLLPGDPEDLLAPSLNFRPGRTAPQEAAADQDKPSRCQIVVDGPAWFMV
jgi:hypothetical protein